MAVHLAFEHVHILSCSTFEDSKSSATHDFRGISAPPGLQNPFRCAKVGLGTYLGWNITGTDGGARPFHKDQICDYVGGMIPFAKTKAEREANKDPRRSLEERYGDHAGYVNAVRAAAANAVAQGFLLQADADALIAQAEASKVLAP